MGWREDEAVWWTVFQKCCSSNVSWNILCKTREIKKKKKGSEPQLARNSKYMEVPRFLGQEDPLEKEIATHSSTLTWKIPWTEEPGWLQSIVLQGSDMT